jgi:hypothetical protein
MTSDITITAAVVAVVPGRDHCQPTVSCDHMATPNARYAVAAHPSDARLARIWSEGSSGLALSPAPVRRATNPLRATSALRRHDRGRSDRSATSNSANSAP